MNHNEKHEKHEIFKNLKKLGIPIRKLNIIMLIVAIFVSLILFVAMRITDSIYNETHSATTKLLDWRKKAYNLQVASDYLTEEIKLVELSDEDKALSSDEMKNKAAMYVFDDEYLNAKNHISTDMNDCLEELEKEIDNEQQEMSDNLKKQVFIEHMLTILLIVIVLGIVIFTSRLVFIPLNNCVDKMRKEEEIPLIGAYEIRFLAKNYNLMYYTNIESKKKLGHEATHDKLTSLYNRRGYEFLLHNVDMETSTLIIIDLDNFKSVNDTYGHDVGDKVIAKAAKTIFNSFRTQDFVCRIGGDEYAVIMIRSDSSMKELIARKITMINEKLSNPGDEEGLPPITCSVGVAFGRIGQNVSEMFKKADTALYETKEKGRNGVTFYGKKIETAK